MTEAEVKNLINKRGQIKAQLTRFNTFMNTSTNQSNILQIQTRLEKVELAWEEFDTVQTQLENLLDDDSSQQSERAAFEEVYFENVVNAKQFIANLKQDSNLTPSSNLGNSDAHTINNVKLPTLNLPTFTGNYEEYMFFFDTFNSLIHQNNTLSNIQKFHYLRSSLKGEASKVIQSLEVSASNYIVAWDLLKERYENRRLIIHNHIKALFEYNPIGKESPVTLRQLLDHFVKHLRALGVLNQPVAQWDTPLLYLVSTKLDAVTKREWESSVIGNDAPTWNAFIKFLTNRCQLLETLNTNNSGNTNSSSSNSNKKPHHKRNDRVTALVSTAGPTCEFCKSAHTIYKCQQFLKLSVRNRAEEVHKLNLCSNCLRRHEENGQCKTSLCRVCNKGHNTLLHTESNTVVEQPSSNMATNGAFKFDRQVLLSTAIVYAYDLNGAAHECRVLLDSGSQLHFITTRFAQMLDLKTSKLNVPVTGVNQTLIKVNFQTQVKLKSKFSNFTSTLNCLILPEITGTLPDVRLDIKGMNIPNHVNLADPTFHLPGKIDMLIGNELFWDLLCEEQLHCGSQQLLLRNTVFGWIAGGSIKQPPKPTKPKVCNLSIEYRIGEQLKQEVTNNILSTAGFELRKFSSNDPRILDSLSTMQESEAVFSITRTDEIKTLGLQWNTKLDTLQYTEAVQPEQSRITKRKILSIISQLYDPLGLLGPIIIKAKILLQKLWQLQLDWDASIPSTLCTEWRELQSELPAIRYLQIPRHVVGSNASHIQLHGFCDASEVAYGAAIYVRSRNDDGTHQGHLLCAKSRVAPLRTTSLPRLELCGALLLAQLMSKTQQILTVNIDNIFYWCDSTIALAWIGAPPHHWQTFVGNRVAAIQELTKSTSWRHVRSEANPADAISRGITPNQLEHHKLWWNGPNWLCQEEHRWPVLHKPEVNDMPEKRKIICTMTRSPHANDDIFSYYSSFIKLQRVVAYLLRFKLNVSVPRKERRTTMLNNQELQASVHCLVKLAQAQEFGRDIVALQSDQKLPRSSKLLTLNPFLDKHGIVRVGGRLTNADLAYTHKHPAVLPQKHPLTKLLILHEHAYLLHAGQQAVLAFLRRQFWPLCARSVVKKTLRACVKCFRVNPRPCENLMGNLPRDRTTPSRPFQKCGVDYAGPFFLKAGRSRAQNLVKAYLCIFVCFSTKAVHLEIVSDLTTECLLNALKRFMSRRGKCSDIYSDNATTFVGANNKLKEVKNFLVDQSQQTKISEFLSQDSINWHFVPSRAPHFGGLWEAAVKTSKSHLKGVIGNAALTFEGFSTVIIQIEACMNSRPISTLSEDPNDLSPLTPGHFLIGDSLVALPDDSLEDLPPARLSHYQRLQQMVQHFWTRWHKEYLHNLQQRHKWHQRSGSLLKPGALVVIREDNSPPLKWNMGRIVKLYPGKDNVCRVVDVQTRQGVLKRPVAKLCLLPVE